MACRVVVKMFGAMHFIYFINRSIIATKVDSTYLGY